MFPCRSTSSSQRIPGRAATALRGWLVAAISLAALCGAGGVLPDAAMASPGWTAPLDFRLPTNAATLATSIAYGTGGTATIAYLEVVSAAPAPLQTVLHVGVIPPGGFYQEQASIVSTSTSIPSQVSLAEAPDGAAVLEYAVLRGADPQTAPTDYLASYRAAASSSWDPPATVASDTTQVNGSGAALVPAIAADGTAAAGVDHVDPAISGGGDRLDVAVHPAGGAWGAATQISPPSTDSRGLGLGFDSGGDLTAAFRVSMGNGRYQLVAERRPVSSGVWGTPEAVTPPDPTSDVSAPILGVAPDGSAVIAFQYVHTVAPSTSDTHAVTRSGATGAWTAPADLTPGAQASAPLAAGVAPDDTAYVLYGLQSASGSGSDCAGAVRAAVGGGFSGPACVSAMGLGLPYHAGVSFLGNDAYFAFSGALGAAGQDAVEGSRWLAGAVRPDNFTDLDAPGAGLALDQVLPDLDGSVAAFWTAGSAATLRAAAFDAGGPTLLSAHVPASAIALQPVSMSVSFADLWSGLGAAPTWTFGDASSATSGSNGTGSTSASSGSGGLVSHTYAKAGTYTVTVTASDGLGNPTTAQYKIAVALPPPSLTRVSQSASRWRETGSAKHPRQPPLGTTLRFSLNEAASVKLAFTGTVGGRHVSYTIRFAGRSGRTARFFDGTISGRKKLPLGRYSLVITASNSGGVAKRTLHFTIVKA